MKIDMCKHYDVWHHPQVPGQWHPRCKVGLDYKAGIRCHSKREECLLYEPSEAKDKDK